MTTTTLNLLTRDAIIYARRQFCLERLNSGKCDAEKESKIFETAIIKFVEYRTNKTDTQEKIYAEVNLRMNTHI